MIKDIKGYEGLYRICNDPVYIETQIDSKKLKKGDKMSFYTTTQGYFSLKLTKNGLSNNRSVHRLLALTFIDNPSNKKCVNHKNGIKKDLRLENLEWCTSSENNKHAYDTGLKKSVSRFGKDHPLSKGCVIYNGTILKEFESFSLAHNWLIDNGFSKSKSHNGTLLFRVCDNSKRRAYGFLVYSTTVFYDLYPVYN